MKHIKNSFITSNIQQTNPIKIHNYSNYLEESIIGKLYVYTAIPITLLKKNIICLLLISNISNSWWLWDWIYLEEGQEKAVSQMYTIINKLIQLKIIKFPEK